MDKPWKVILAFIGVFVAGAVFGGLLALRIGRAMAGQRAAATTVAPTMAVSSPDASAAKPTPVGPQPNLPAPQAVQSAQLLRRITNQLGLTRAQRERVTPFIDRAVQDLWRNQQNFNRENTFLTQRLKQDIGKELTADQQTRLDDLFLKQIETFRKRQAEAAAQRQAEAAASSQPKPAGTMLSAPAAGDSPRAAVPETVPPASRPPSGGK